MYLYIYTHNLQINKHTHTHTHTKTYTSNAAFPNSYTYVFFEDVPRNHPASQHCDKSRLLNPLKYVAKHRVRLITCSVLWDRKNGVCVYIYICVCVCVYMCVCVCICVCVCVWKRARTHNLVFAIPSIRPIQQIISQVSQPFHVPSCKQQTNKQTTSKNVVTSSKKQVAFLSQRSVDKHSFSFISEHTSPFANLTMLTRTRSPDSRCGQAGSSVNINRAINIR